MEATTDLDELLCCNSVICSSWRLQSWDFSWKSQYLFEMPVLLILITPPPRKDELFHGEILFSLLLCVLRICLQKQKHMKLRLYRTSDSNWGQHSRVSTFTYRVISALVYRLVLLTICFNMNSFLRAFVRALMRKQPCYLDTTVDSDARNAKYFGKNLLAQRIWKF